MRSSCSKFPIVLLALGGILFPIATRAQQTTIVSGDPYQLVVSKQTNYVGPSLGIGGGFVENVGGLGFTAGIQAKYSRLIVEAPFLCHRIYDLSRLQASGMKVPSTSIETGLELHVEALFA